MEPSDLIAHFEEKDHFSRLLGIELVEVAPGFARARMQISQRHNNCFGTAHAGAVFALADTAFGAAVNARGQLSLAVSINCHFLKPGRAGMLTATAREASPGPRLASYDLEVRDEDGELVAAFQAMAYRKKTSLAEAAKQMDQPPADPS